MTIHACYCPVRDGSTTAPSEHPDEPPYGDPWLAFSYLVSGAAVYGLIGWGLDRWLGTKYLVVIGILLGVGLGDLHDFRPLRRLASTQDKQS